LHVGRQIDPDFRLFVQVPLFPFVGLADASHVFGLHVADVNFPAKQLVAPDTTKLLLHFGRQTSPDARLFVQVPAAPFAGTGTGVHIFGLHVAAVKVPAKQLVGPDATYPLSHSTKHVDPDSRFDVQLPLFPFVGLADASHEFGLHIAAVNVPAKQVVGAAGWSK
jgi:hypothetical protein